MGFYGIKDVILWDLKCPRKVYSFRNTIEGKESAKICSTAQNA